MTIAGLRSLSQLRGLRRLDLSYTPLEVGPCIFYVPSFLPACLPDACC